MPKQHYFSITRYVKRYDQGEYVSFLISLPDSYTLYIFKMYTIDPVAIKPFAWKLFKYEAQIYIRNLTTQISLHLIKLL